MGSVLSNSPSNHSQELPKLLWNKIIKGEVSRYIIKKELGNGSFGRVVKCIDLNSNKQCALKILKPDCNTEREVGVLNILNKCDTEKYNFIKFIEKVQYKKYNCLVFEYLDENMFEFVSYGHRLRVCEIRLIAQQMLVAFAALEKVGIIHCDLKPDNIMLTNHRLYPFKVKLIDFGLARKVEDLKPGMKLQALPYRAFEVIIGLPLGHKIDMWSLGCCLSYMYTRKHLFPNAVHSVLRKMLEMLGPVDNDLLSRGDHTRSFFNQVDDKWKLKPVEEFKPQKELSKFHSGLKKLSDLSKFSSKVRDEVEKKDEKAFLNFLKQTLCLDPNKRISALEGLCHDFITMEHLKSVHWPYIAEVKQSFERCQLRPIYTYTNDSDDQLEAVTEPFLCPGCLKCTTKILPRQKTYTISEETSSTSSYTSNSSYEDTETSVTSRSDKLKEPGTLEAMISQRILQVKPLTKEDAACECDKTQDNQRVSSNRPGKDHQKPFKRKRSKGKRDKKGRKLGGNTSENLGAAGSEGGRQASVSSGVPKRCRERSCTEATKLSCMEPKKTRTFFQRIRGFFSKTIFGKRCRVSPRI